MATLSRGFIVNRAFVADRWLQDNFGVTVMDATDLQLLQFIESTPANERPRTLHALVAYGDDMVRKGRVSLNRARTIKLP